MARQAPGWLPGPWLPGDEAHPLRLDLPVVRHLTFTEAHAFELGLGLAALVWWAHTIGAVEAIVPVVVLAARVVLGDRRAKGETTECDHTLGVHDIRMEPQYFTTAAIGGYVVLWAATFVLVVDTGVGG